ncbi:bifunctional 2-C-methyl-D-erythritol 4-phosphate cytidylyltransferase/2-C-methyl-D-erythritol 2,4-cyclodiphosphate synthase [Helicobacter fennelliae]|uniref:Bifunctional enzyme IspD/IspF n=1 Tax=Helicobacter fennelliae MRY12-0050 TaxID=1325130 RepID=T1DWI2_9HELI|nr:bifunctional 2-C-methyl-D-erythritol 4-phosphate cytidylyltransferase/2-C-methyl-D-erythritol 2,4-cyclodiphosphate synthase [Helicobacter fennelliae]GAD19663.1 2-C-methyl-D-erythritol 4-phosphate cytidylyltransferase [Helicobacter fennelliae MRY12-0050]STP07952.1 bifunctional 2-C-methyl-D-erythritol 4-phosphate cytidylyltransferase/2-C-methyl-D-erythritol 2,4-cyclodiphosphate synthase [Helicobacter fennelliae]STQ84120.1 bifunctional 2-C-methyl-D-erythritol 4-phosphate cytidylyltransferase/2-C
MLKQTKNHSNTLPNIHTLPTTLVLMAAGDSLRFRQDIKTKQHKIKKQWLRLKENKPLWLFVADKLARLYPFEHIIITASESDYRYMCKMCDYQIIKGGITRQESLRNALEQVQTEHVLVSDVARFNVSQEIIDALFSLMIQEQYDCIAPTIGIADTIYYDTEYINRDKLLRIQTPQLSKTQILKLAINTYQSTDESSIIAKIGGKVGYIQGNEKLAKLTFKQDLQALESFIDNDSFVYVGNGIDIHGFEKGKKMMLGGVEIQSDVGFKAHSDGDVLLHSIADSILGAMGAGDIGEWFPDTDETFKNADSAILLRQIYDFAKSVGFKILNLDVTILAQTPKISPYKKAIQSRLSEILEIPLFALNIKATTAEKLGFIGREEGVCVLSSVSLKTINLKEIINETFNSRE